VRLPGPAKAKLLQFDHGVAVESLMRGDSCSRWARRRRSAAMLRFRPA
jgi:hypothetical protein